MIKMPVLRLETAENDAKYLKIYDKRVIAIILVNIDLLACNNPLLWDVVLTHDHRFISMTVIQNRESLLNVHKMLLDIRCWCFTVKVFTAYIVKYNCASAKWNLQDLCDQQRLISACTFTQYGKGSRLSLFWQSGGFRMYMRSVKTDQTARLRRLTWVFAGRTKLIVGFVVRWLNWIPYKFMSVI